MTSAALQPPCQTAAASPPQSAVRLHRTIHRLAPMLQTRLQSMMNGLGCFMKTWVPEQQTQPKCHLDLLLQRKHLCRLQIFTRAVTFFHPWDFFCKVSASANRPRLMASAVTACAKGVFVPHRRPLLCA